MQPQLKVSSFRRDPVPQVPGHQLTVCRRLGVTKHPVLAGLRKANVKYFESVERVRTIRASYGSEITAGRGAFR